MFDAPAGSPGDFGPIYAETDMSRFPVEPWNTFSNLAFLVLAAYWFLKIRKDWRNHGLLALSLPVLLLGFIGGSLYHATRSHSLWLLMDYLPIMILILTAAIFMWREVLGSLWLTFLVTMSLPTAYRLVTIFIEIPEGVFVSIGYAVLALSVCLPACVHCALRNRNGAKWLVLSALSFVLAILFRQYDMALAKSWLLPQGGHFLWHLFGAGSAFSLMQYLYSSDLVRNSKADAFPATSSVTVA